MRPNSQARTGTGEYFFPVQLTTSRIGNLTRLIHTLLYVMTIHTYIHTYILLTLCYYHRGTNPIKCHEEVLSLQPMCASIQVHHVFLSLFWCPCMAIDVSVHFNGGFLPDIILLTLCYDRRGIRLNALKRFLKKNLNASKPSN